MEYLNYVRDMDVPMSFAIEYGGEAIGGIGFKLGLDIARLSVEMGYWLGEPFWPRPGDPRGHCLLVLGIRRLQRGTDICYRVRPQCSINSCAREIGVCP